MRVRMAEEFEQHSIEGDSDPELHLGNPVYTYLFIKRLTVDWQRTVREDILTNYSQGNLQPSIELRYSQLLQ